MGFYIDDNVVKVNHKHNNYAITTSDKNPFISNDGIRIIGLFKRTKNKRRKDEKALGDNCPMLYALKGINGLRTNFRSVHLLHIEFKKILTKLVEANTLALRENQPAINTWDIVISLPSSSKLSHSLAKRVARELGHTYTQDLLSKVTVSDTYAQVKGLQQSHSITSSTSSQLISALNTATSRRDLQPTDLFQMKFLPLKHRKHINPFKVTDTSTLEKEDYKKILLVDDIASSGTSMNTAAKLLNEYYPNALIEGLTLFSQLK